MLKNLRLNVSTVTGLIGLGLIIILVIVAILAPFISPYEPDRGTLTSRLRPPAWAEGGSSEYLLGTDSIGRDMLTRLIYGARTSLIVASFAILLAGTIGTTLGIIAGYMGGWIETIIMRVVDLAFAFPAILLAMVFAVVFEPGFGNIIIVISLILWAEYARMARGETLRVKEMDYVALAKVAGISRVQIMLKHILPNISTSLIVLATLQVGIVIILESSLSFLGVGIPPPTPSWGTMIADGRSYIVTAWWLSLVPGVAIVTTVLSFNLLGDALTEILNPGQQ